VLAKRLFYFSSHEVTAHRWSRGELHQEAVFGMNENGVAEFGRYVAARPDSLFYVLADVIEEDFFLENIPYVRGSDRSALLARKLSQRYRDSSLAAPISLGAEVHAGRREERILYTSFTNTQQFQPWLEALRARDARVVGVFSVALLAATLGKKLGFKPSRYVMVSLQHAGLRQSYVENGRIRFSRVARVNQSDPAAIAQGCAAESLRTHQYLVNSRILPRDAPALDVLVLAPQQHKALYDAACVDSPRLHFHVHELEKAARNVGLKSQPADALGEHLFLHVLAQSAPRDQFADAKLRHFYELWRARMGMLTAGAAVMALCLVLAAERFLDAYLINQQTVSNRVQEARASEEYSRLQARFPKTPTPTESLRAIVKNYRTLLRQSVSPTNLFVEISQALTTLPQIEIDKIDWEVAVPKAGDAGKAPPGRPAAATPGQPGDAPVQTAEIAGRLIVPQASDYRAVTALVTQFTDALRARPGTELNRTQLPFDINAEKSLSGDIGAARREEVPQFSVSISKRRGA